MAVLIAVNVAVVVYHGDRRDMVAQASDVENPEVAQVVKKLDAPVKPVLAQATGA